LVKIWVIVSIQKPSNHILQTFRPLGYACLRSCSATVHFIRNHCLYIVCQGRTQGWWVGLIPPLVWHVTKTLLPAKRKLFPHTSCLLICRLHAKIVVVNALT